MPCPALPLLNLTPTSAAVVHHHPNGHVQLSESRSDLSILSSSLALSLRVPPFLSMVTDFAYTQKL